MLSLTSPLSILPKTHTTTLKRLEKAGVHTVGDMLRWYPRRYIDYSQSSSIDHLQPGDVATVTGRVTEAKNVYARGHLTLQHLVVHDGTGHLKLTWFNQPYIVKNFPVGTTIAAAGEVERIGKWLQMKPDEYEKLTDDTSTHRHTGKLIPFYPQRQGITSRLLREKITYVLDHLDPQELTDWLPADIVSRHHLLPFPRALLQSHLPADMAEATAARGRLAFDELFTIQLATCLVRRDWESVSPSHVITLVPQVARKVARLIESLPFEMTESQKKSWREIALDLMEDHPMNRFLQGDVGSGKTLVAALAAYTVVLNGYDVLFMCPTEILATQHYATLTQVLGGGISIQLVTASSSKSKISKGNTVNTAAKDPESQDRCRSGMTDGFGTIYIGTQALISKGRAYERVGLVITDEQHRFGVRQRGLLKDKGAHPHTLTMTATPIPRTVALTLFADLDMSVLTDMPKGRLPVKSYVVPPEKRDPAYAWIAKLIGDTGCQAFVICPRIEEKSDGDEGGKPSETSLTMKAAVLEAARLQRDVFPHLKIGLLHGKLKSAEKAQVMADFKEKKYHILVSTTVVEVGIDIPNATVIIIEGAERFGLAQLHQLRGRVGRDDAQSYCLLFTSDGIPTSEKLFFFAKTVNGMELAEYDFRNRGPGDIYGTAQSGASSLQIANLFDYALIEKTKTEAETFASVYTPSAFPAVATALEKYNLQHITKD